MVWLYNVQLYKNLSNIMLIRKILEKRPLLQIALIINF